MRLSKYPEESLDEYVQRRNSRLRDVQQNKEFAEHSFRGIEDISKSINEIEENFFKIQEILKRCTKTNRRKIKQLLVEEI